MSRTSSGPSSSALGDAWTMHRGRAGADALGGGPGGRRGAGWAQVGRRGHRGAPGHRRRSGVGVPGLYDPATGATEFLVNMPGDWRGVPVAGPVERRAGPADGPRQRRPGVRAGRAAAGRRSGCPVHDRPDAGHRHRRCHRASTDRCSRATRAPPASSATRSSTLMVRCATAALAAASRRSAEPSRSRRSAARTRWRRRCAAARAGDAARDRRAGGDGSLPGHRHRQRDRAA